MTREEWRWLTSFSNAPRYSPEWIEHECRRSMLIAAAEEARRLANERKDSGWLRSMDRLEMPVAKFERAANER